MCTCLLYSGAQNISVTNDGVPVTVSYHCYHYGITVIVVGISFRKRMGRNRRSIVKCFFFTALKILLRVIVERLRCFSPSTCGDSDKINNFYIVYFDKKKRLVIILAYNQMKHNVIFVEWYLLSITSTGVAGLTTLYSKTPRRNEKGDYELWTNTRLKVQCSGRVKKSEDKISRSRIKYRIVRIIPKWSPDN